MTPVYREETKARGGGRGKVKCLAQGHIARKWWRTSVVRPPKPGFPLRSVLCTRSPSSSRNPSRLCGLQLCTCDLVQKFGAHRSCWPGGTWREEE